VCLWLGNRVPYLIKSVTILELEEANKLVSKYERRKRMPAPFEYPPLELVLDVQVEST
jgi:hypothetical protein